MDIVKGNMQTVGVEDEDARDKMRWKETICCGDP